MREVTFPHHAGEVVFDAIHWDIVFLDTKKCILTPHHTDGIKIDYDISFLANEGVLKAYWFLLSQFDWEHRRIIGNDDVQYATLVSIAHANPCLRPAWEAWKSYAFRLPNEAYLMPPLLKDIE